MRQDIHYCTAKHPWLHPPKGMALVDEDVHMRRASLGLAAARIQDLQCTLTSDERERAERFHFPKDRNHFIVARGVLRGILSRYLGMEPGHLRCCYNP
jgi:4'-phosphopantetheinyl transferase